MVRQRPEQELGEEAAVRPVLRIVLAVLEAPGGEVRGREVGGEEAVAAGEADRVGEDGAGDGVAWAEPRAGTGRFGLFGLQADVELEVVDVAVECLCRVL